MRQEMLAQRNQEEIVEFLVSWWLSPFNKFARLLCFAFFNVAPCKSIARSLLQRGFQFNKSSKMTWTMGACFWYFKSSCGSEEKRSCRYASWRWILSFRKQVGHSGDHGLGFALRCRKSGKKNLQGEEGIPKHQTQLETKNPIWFFQSGWSGVASPLLLSSTQSSLSSKNSSWKLFACFWFSSSCFKNPERSRICFVVFQCCCKSTFLSLQLCRTLYKSFSFASRPAEKLPCPKFRQECLFLGDDNAQA